MARCCICDKGMDKDTYPKPCTECELIITETIQAFDRDVPINYIESELVEYNEEVGSTDRTAYMDDA